MLLGGEVRAFLVRFEGLLAIGIPKETERPAMARADKSLENSRACHQRIRVKATFFTMASPTAMAITVDSKQWVL